MDRLSKKTNSPTPSPTPIGRGAKKKTNSKVIPLADEVGNFLKSLPIGEGFRVGLFFLLFSFTTFAQKAYVLGKAIDKATGKPIVSATVLNKNTKQLTKTSDNGNFLVRATKGDSIKISSIGYKMAAIAWDGTNTEPTIEMRQDAIALPEIVIRDRRMEQVKKQIDELMATPEASNKLKWKDISNLINTNTSAPGTIGISIDGLYELFSKEGKSRRKLAAMKQEDLRKLLVEYRYNAEYISFVTKLKGQELKNFMKFCNLPENFVLTASDYDLTLEVYRCLDEFQRVPSFKY